MTATRCDAGRRVGHLHRLGTVAYASFSESIPLFLSEGTCFTTYSVQIW